MTSASPEARQEADRHHAAIRRLREISDRTPLPPGAPTAEQLVREDRDGSGKTPSDEKRVP